MNLPNKLTLSRIVLVPFFVAAMLIPTGWEEQKWVALAIFIVASLTDYADGKIARSRGLVKNFGKFMDPLADKLLVCSALICLSSQQRLSAWITVIIIAREFIISGFRLLASDNGVVIAASPWGKAKTVSQIVMIVVLIADLAIPEIIPQILVWIATALTVVSLVDYLAKNIKLISDYK